MQYAGKLSAIEYRIRGYGFALGDANQLHRTRWDMVISLIGGQACPLMPTSLPTSNPGTL